MSKVKVKVNVDTVCIKHCGQDTDYSFLSNHFQILHAYC